MRSITFLSIFTLGVALAFSPSMNMEVHSPQHLVEISGIVLDADTKEPLIGASIYVNKKNGTITDLKGKFTISVPQDSWIKIEYTGYLQEKLFIQESQSNVVIRMKVAAILEEVVVVGYAPPKTDMQTTGSISTIRYDQPSSRRKIRKALRNNMIKLESEVIHNTEDYDHIQENIFHRPVTNPLSTFSIDVDAASYANLRRMIQSGQAPPIDAVRIEEMVNYFSYDYAEPKGKHPFSVYTEIGECPWQPDHHLVHIGLQGKRIPTQDLPASNFVFLLDVSGSMHSYNKLPLVKSALKMLVENLREQDRVSMVTYAGASGLVLPSTSGADKQSIIDAVENLEAGGSTAGAAGINLAYLEATKHFIEGGNNRVILATDGDFNVGVSSDAELVRLIEKKRESGVFLSVLGFGTGNYKDNKMQKLAQTGNGHHAYIDNVEEARKVLVTEFGSSMYSIAKDVKIQIEFNPAKVSGYRLIGYENRLLNDEDFNDDLKDAGEIGAGHTVTAIYQVIPRGVNSEFLKSVDDLKYTANPSSNMDQDEWLTCKIRYKHPEESKSQLIVNALEGSVDDWQECSQDFHWSAAVAAWGMYLRDSAYKGNITRENLLGWAQDGKGADPHGYRAEMIKMVRTSDLLADR